MAELDSGIKKVLLVDRNAPVRTRGSEIHFVNDEDSATSSAKEVYFRWVARLVILCAIVSLSFFLSSSLVIFRLAPEIIIEPLLIIRQDESSRMVRYEPITKKMPSFRQFTEMFIKQYVILRNTVVNDEREMRTRWGPGGIVQYMSTPEVYVNFVGQNMNSIQRMYDSKYSSEVRIDEIGKESENSPAWSVRFTIFNLSQSRGNSGSLTLKTERYKASVTPKYFPQRRLIRARLINPLGFTVVKYNQSEIRD